MTKREENKLTMYKAVTGTLKNNKEKTASIPAFATVEEQFVAALNKIETVHNKHQSVAKGAAQQKGVNEDDMIDELVTLGSVLYVLAVQKGDIALQEATKVTESDLKKKRDAELATEAKNLFNIAEDNGSELANYGINGNKLKAIGLQIETYADALESTETVAAEKTAARQGLGEAFDQADHVLKNMIDPLMEIFHASDSDFYNQYFSARVIKDL